MALALVVAGAALIALRFQPSPFTMIRACLRVESWPPALFHLTNAADARIFVAYVWIPVLLVRLRPKLGIPLGWIFYLVAAFVGSCGLTHLVAIFTGYVPWYWLAYDVKEITADVSLATAAALQWVVGPRLEAEAAKYRRAVQAEQDRTEEAKRGQENEARERQVAEATAGRLAEALDRERGLTAALAESSAPIMRLGNRVIALIVVGPVAEARASVLMERACHAVASERAKGLLIDVSSVTMMDTSAVAALGQVARAVRNQGARCVFAGISPEIAITMARAGIQFEGGAGTALDAESALLLLGADK